MFRLGIHLQSSSLSISTSSNFRTTSSESCWAHAFWIGTIKWVLFSSLLKTLFLATRGWGMGVQQSKCHVTEAFAAVSCSAGGCMAAWSCEESNPFLPYVVFVRIFYQSSRRRKKLRLMGMTHGLWIVLPVLSNSRWWKTASSTSTGEFILDEGRNTRWATFYTQICQRMRSSPDEFLALHLLPTPSPYPHQSLPSWLLHVLLELYHFYNSLGQWSSTVPNAAIL